MRPFVKINANTYRAVQAAPAAPVERYPEQITPEPHQPGREPGPVTIILGPLPADIVNGNLPRRKFKTWAEYDAWHVERNKMRDYPTQLCYGRWDEGYYAVAAEGFQGVYAGAGADDRRDETCL